MQTSDQDPRFGEYDGLLQHVPDIVYAHDLDGRFTAVNHALELLSGYSTDELLSMDVDQVVPGTRDTIREIIPAGKRQHAQQWQLKSVAGSEP